MLQTILLDERKLYHLERCGERKNRGFEVIIHHPKELLHHDRIASAIGI
jgi:predicted metalloprotease